MYNPAPTTCHGPPHVTVVSWTPSATYTTAHATSRLFHSILTPRMAAGLLQDLYSNCYIIYPCCATAHPLQHRMLYIPANSDSHHSKGGPAKRGVQVSHSPAIDERGNRCDAHNAAHDAVTHSSQIINDRLVLPVLGQDTGENTRNVSHNTFFSSAYPVS
jgi:hypothetical protein